GLYMRIGIGIFSFGSLLHHVLILIEHVDISLKCNNHLVICEKLLFVIFNFIQFFFIFKNSNIIIHNYRSLAYFGVMHVTITNICSWFHAIITETKLEITSHDSETLLETNHSTLFSKLFQSKDTNITNPSILCNHPNYGSELITKTEYSLAPYLFPFTVEYTLMSFTLFLIIWQNLGRKLSSKTTNHEHHNDNASTVITDDGINKNCHKHHGDDEHEHVFNVNCQKSIRGLFTGFLILAGTIMTIITYFIYKNVDKQSEIFDSYLSVMMSKCSQLVLNCLMFGVIILGYIHTRQLKIRWHTTIVFDEVLVIFSSLGTYLFAIFSLLSAAFSNHIQVLELLTLIVSILQIIECTLQTLFILDGLRRRANTHKAKREKPGREFVALLIVLNISLWLLDTFISKKMETNQIQVQFYDKITWAIIHTLAAPLSMFYKFHSSVCLSDMWQAIYA
ncbi:unnamed protein product, partial [Didymodactylos carnosus]